MIDKKFVVFSGFNTAVVEAMRPHLKGNNISFATVKIDSAEYFGALSRQAIFEIDRATFGGNVRLSAILVSAISEESSRDEYASFFPALLRLEIPKDQAHNKSASRKIFEKIDSLFRDKSYSELISLISARKNSHLLLPVQNVNVPSLQKMFNAIYSGDDDRRKEGVLSVDLDSYKHTVLKKITISRKSKTLNMGELKFTPALNGPEHPIRRCTDTPVCDLKAKLRFGALVHERFEFDVSSDRKLSAKQFRLCGGLEMRPEKDETHLNMRINDDFKGG